MKSSKSVFLTYLIDKLHKKFLRHAIFSNGEWLIQRGKANEILGRQCIHRNEVSGIFDLMESKGLLEQRDKRYIKVIKTEG